jgi:hypothetical protein
VCIIVSTSRESTSWTVAECCKNELHKSTFLKVAGAQLPDIDWLTIFWVVVGLERGPLSLVSTIEGLLGRKSRSFVLESRKYDRRDPSRWPRGTLYPQKLVLTSSTSGGRSAGIVRSMTQATEFVFFLFDWLINLQVGWLIDCPIPMNRILAEIFVVFQLLKNSSPFFPERSSLLPCSQQLSIGLCHGAILMHSTHTL